MPRKTSHLDLNNLSAEDMRSVLHQCHEICAETLQYCLEQGGKHAHPHHLRLMLYCTEICQISENFLTRGSDMLAIVNETCADICERCAEDCERFGDDNQMRACAEVCRSCASVCRQPIRRAA